MPEAGDLVISVPETAYSHGDMLQTGCAPPTGALVVRSALTADQQD
ncbi:MAG: hypothetical protein JWP55_5356 [Mycobacterium sp.]|nr:hypothetical protein [Mycobacterium sp.]